MIDNCPSDVAGWSEDGETFVVKDPTRFEQSIIPQFFKHSKFSSFVRVRAMDGCFNASVRADPVRSNNRLVLHSHGSHSYLRRCRLIYFFLQRYYSN
jgi:HSF-type DNA-binding